MTYPSLMKKDLPHFKKLLEHKHIYDTYIRTGEIINLHPHIKDEIADAYRVEYPNYYYNKACTACVIEMLEVVYSWYQSQINENI
jgi:hypothetical protein